MGSLRTTRLRRGLLALGVVTLLVVIWQRGGHTQRVQDPNALKPRPEWVSTWRKAETPLLPTPERVIVIGIDTLRSDHLSSNGHPRPTSPVLDEMAASEGIRFARAYSSASWTLPSMTSIFTSLHPHQHGVEDRGMRLRADVPTLAMAFAAQGWRTAGFVTHIYVTSLFGLHNGFQEFFELSIQPRYAEGFQIDAAELNNQVLPWLKKHRDERFFLYLHYFDPHWDYEPPEAFRDPFVDRSYRGQATGRWDFLEEYLPRDRLMDPEDLRHVRALYEGEIAHTDAQLGRLFDVLRSSGLWEDSLIVVLSDHGEEFQEHGGLSHIVTLYEEVLRVPLLFKLPGGRPTEWRPVVEERVRNIDIAASILELSGLAVPPTFLGRSLVPLMQEAGVDRDVFARTLRHGSDKTALIRGRHKIIRGLGERSGRVELYDLEDDPGETRSLVADEPETVERMAAALDAFLAGEGVVLSAPAADAGVELTPEQKEQLRRLGYAE